MIDPGTMQLIMALLGTVFTGAKSIQFVQEGEAGCVLRFGKVVRKKNIPKVVKPGFVLLVPFADKLKRRHVRQQTIRFQKQEVLIQGNLVFEINAIIRFQIQDLYKALFVIEELEESLQDFVSGQLLEVVQKKQPEELINTEIISKELMEKLVSLEEEWGVKFHESKLTSCAPTPQSAKLITIDEEATRRAKVAKKLQEEHPDLKPILPALVGANIAMNLK